MKRILITGPESTGKSELARDLASHYQGHVVPEYSRDYIQNLGRSYLFSDVEQIALKQVEEYEDSTKLEWVFFDTWLIITKVWFRVVYNRVPPWLDKSIRIATFDLVLLCDTDIPWIPDSVRENGGSMREELLQRYKDELNFYGLDWVLVNGSGLDRSRCAKQYIEKKLGDGHS